MQLLYSCTNSDITVSTSVIKLSQCHKTKELKLGNEIYKRLISLSERIIQMCLADECVRERYAFPNLEESFRKVIRAKRSDSCQTVSSTAKKYNACQ